jgi:hypothetical protein
MAPASPLDGIRVARSRLPGYGSAWKRFGLAAHDHPAASKAAPTAATAAGIASGAGAALLWAAGFAAARHGIAAGFSPADLAFHRYVWMGLALLPWVARAGFADLMGVSWARALTLTLFVGPLFSIISYAGFLLVPLGHGGVIQPSCAALGGLLLAATVLKERLPVGRVAGAGIIVAGLIVIGGEALVTIGTHGLLGDFAFAVAGLMFAVFGMLLRLWRIAPVRAVVVTCVASRTSCRSRCRASLPARSRPICSPVRWCSWAPAAPRCFPRWCRASRCSSAMRRSARCRASRRFWGLRSCSPASG